MMMMICVSCGHTRPADRRAAAHRPIVTAVHQREEIIADQRCRVLQRPCLYVLRVGTYRQVCVARSGQHLSWVPVPEEATVTKALGSKRFLPTLLTIGLLAVAAVASSPASANFVYVANGYTTIDWVQPTNGTMPWDFAFRPDGQLIVSTLDASKYGPTAVVPTPDNAAGDGFLHLVPAGGAMISAGNRWGTLKNLIGLAIRRGLLYGLKVDETRGCGIPSATCYTALYALNATTGRTLRRVAWMPNVAAASVLVDPLSSDLIFYTAIHTHTSNGVAFTRFNPDTGKTAKLFTETSDPFSSGAWNPEYPDISPDGRLIAVAAVNTAGPVDTGQSGPREQIMVFTRSGQLVIRYTPPMFVTQVRFGSECFAHQLLAINTPATNSTDQTFSVYTIGLPLGSKSPTLIAADPFVDQTPAGHFDVKTDAFVIANRTSVTRISCKGQPGS